MVDIIDELKLRCETNYAEVLLAKIKNHEIIAHFLVLKDNPANAEKLFIPIFSVVTNG